MNTDNITVNTQSSIRIEGSKVLYFDPFQISQEKGDADFIFITHDHYDHFDADSIRHIWKESTVFVIPAGMEKDVRELVKERRIICLKPGDKLNATDCDGICVEAVPVRPFRSTRKPRPVLSDTLYWRISPSFTDTSKLEPDS